MRYFPTNIKFDFLSQRVDKCLDESKFVSQEKQSVIHPSIKGQGPGQDNMANYRPVSNLTFLFKIKERAMLDQLWKVLLENKIIPVHQSAYQKLHSNRNCPL